MKFLVSIFLLISFHAGAQYTYMVKDLSGQNEPSNSKSFIQSGGLDYFIANDGIHGEELWRTDGTAAGTFMLKDIYPGETAGMDTWPHDPLFVAANGNLFFTATGSANNQELWFTDGSPSGTNYTAPYESGQNIVYYNGSIYYFFNDSLFKTDGTVSGTSLIFTSPAAAGVSPPRALTAANGYLYFVGYDAANGYEPWISDGTTGGTHLLKDVNPGTATSWPTVTGANAIRPVFYESAGKVIFPAAESSTGHELWVTDGTVIGTQLLKDIYPGTTSGVGDQPVIMTNTNGKFYFYADDGLNGVELWISDGTTNGTSMLYDFNAVHATIIPEIINVNGIVYFTAHDTAGTMEIWKTDGTTAGTSMVTDLSASQPAPAPYALTAVNNQLYFIMSSMNSMGAVVYTSDGTASGTYSLATGAGYNNPTPFCQFNGDLYFAFTDTLQNAELCKISTVTNTLQVIKDIKPGSSLDFIWDIHEYNGNLIFTAADAITDKEPWISDGTTAGTALLKDINTNGNSHIDQLQDLNGLLLFSANDAVHGNELWKSNGHETGTNMVFDANPLPFYGSVPYHLETFKNKVYYRCYPVSNPDSNFYYNFWSSNGQAAETGSFGNLMMSPDFLKTLGNKLYISSANGFYVSDGTAAGTHLLLMNNMQEAVSAGEYVYASTFNGLYSFDSLNNSTSVAIGNNIEHLTVVYDTVYFIMNIQQMDTLWLDSVNFITMMNYHDQLWQSAGLVSNTSMVADNFHANAMIASGSDLFALAGFNNIYGLYKYNSNSGITLIKTLAGNAQNNVELNELNGKIFFQGADSTGDSELWISDGTTSGTFPVKDINITGSSYPDQLTVFNNEIFFTADDGINGRELWRTDGTTASTSMVTDIHLSGNSNPAELTVSRDNLYFVADDGVHGRELWAHALFTTAACFAYFETSYDTSANTFTLAIDPVSVAAATAFHWDFGDGSFSSQSNPSHAYAANAIYNVCLTIYTASGDSCKFCHDLGIDIDGNVLLKGSGFNIVVVNGVSNIESVDSGENKVFLIPNPSNGNATLIFSSAASASVNVLNMEGKTVKSVSEFNSGGFLYISDQPAGIYIIEITSGNLRQRIKLNKQ